MILVVKTKISEPFKIIFISSETQMEYCKILLIRNHLNESNKATSMRILKKY
jgi:hypothetical protein